MDNPRGIQHIWGTSKDERALEFPCDELVDEATDTLFRAISVRASRQTVYRWLCQLRLAPYSYDWLDNLGRESPKRLVEGVDRLEPGQQIMHSFEVASFEPGRHLTARTRAGRSRAVLGDVAASYLLLDEPPGCRVVFKAAIRLPGGKARQSLMRAVLPHMDLVLMRRQLHTIRDLAERSPVG